jgi:hypothetical protein
MQGAHEVDASATAIMNKVEGGWIQWHMTPQTMVGMECRGEPAVALPRVQQPLEAFLSQLEVSGHVPLQVFKHTCTRVTGQTGKYNLSTDSVALVLVKPADAAETTLTVDNAAKFINIHGLKTAANSQVNWQLVFSPSEQKLIKPDWPKVFLKANVKLAAKEALRIAAPTASITPVPMVAAGALGA